MSRIQRPTAREPIDLSRADQSNIRATAVEQVDSDIRSTRQTVGGIEIEAILHTARSLPARSSDAPGEPYEGPPLHFRPTIRPPTAVLRILDDNQLSGESIRIRQPEFSIGREMGDLIIPEDLQMSGEHAIIERVSKDQGCQWYLRDLNSTNGSYIRADFVRVRDGEELLIGCRCFRFGLDPSRPNVLEFVELTLNGSAARFVLNDEDFWIGREQSSCHEYFWSDPLLDWKHAHVYRDERGWCVRSESTLNGIWARVAQVRLVNGCWFQLGEQRFRIFLF